MAEGAWSRDWCAWRCAWRSVVYKLTLPICCDARLDVQQKTPLHLAVSNSHEAVTRVLVQGGANVRAKDMHVCMYACILVWMCVCMYQCVLAWMCVHMCVRMPLGTKSSDWIHMCSPVLILFITHLFCCAFAVYRSADSKNEGQYQQFRHHKAARRGPRQDRPIKKISMKSTRYKLGQQPKP